MDGTINISPSLGAGNKNEALKELAEIAASQRPNIAAEEILCRLQERESLGSTAKGDGFAIPHGKIPGMKEVFICFARSVKGISFDAPDNKPVHLIFMLLVPEKMGEEYLEHLSRLTSFLNSSHVRKQLINAADESECRKILARNE